MFAVGDVILFQSAKAGKLKYHLCLSLDGHYVFLNSLKHQIYPSDFIFECDELSFLSPTDTGKSTVSCAFIMQIPQSVLTAGGAKKLGSASTDFMLRLARFVESCPVMTDEEKDLFLEAMGDWL